MGFIKSIFSAFGRLFRWLGDKQLIEAGEANQELKQREKIDENVSKVNAARRDPDKLKRVRNKYQRK